MVTRTGKTKGKKSKRKTPKTRSRKNIIVTSKGGIIIKEEVRESIIPIGKEVIGKKIKPRLSPDYKDGDRFAIHFRIDSKNTQKNTELFSEILGKYKEILKKNHIKYKITIRQGSDDIELIGKFLGGMLYEAAKKMFYDLVTYLDDINSNNENETEVITDIGLDMESIHKRLTNALYEREIKNFRIDQYNTLKVGVQYKGILLDSGECWQINIYWNLDVEEIPC